MPSSNAADYAPSSPLSSAPSDIESWTPPHIQSTSAADENGDPVEYDDEAEAIITVKRKAPASQSVNGRASRRRRTGDDFGSTLNELKDEIIVPKLKPAAQTSSRGKASKQQMNGDERSNGRASSPAVVLENAEAEPVEESADRLDALKPEPVPAVDTEVLSGPDTVNAGAAEDVKVVEETPQSSGRPSRRRVAPTKLSDVMDTPVKQVASARRKTQPLRGNWSANHLLTNPKSKLASCNLNELLSHERAWTLLSRSEQLELLSMLPTFAQPSIPDLPDDIELPNFLRQALKSNSSFQADIRLFQEDLAAGRYEPQWLSDAAAAMEKRGRGYFDDWKEKNREEFWGQKQKVDWTALSGETAQWTLMDLAKAGIFEVGDVWRLRRQGRESGAVVDKEAKLVAVAGNGRLTFSFPPGQHKFSGPSSGEDVVVEDIDTPNALCSAILKEDGRLMGVRTANAWKDFRCLRNEQDMGSLWDVRELYHNRQSD